MKALLALGGLLVAAAAGFGGAALWVLAPGLPEVTALEDFAPPTSSRVYAADGSLLAEFSTQRRTPVSIDAVPESLIRCVLAIEDHRFYEHRGINFGRILKALAVDVVEGRIVEGGSTITQQLAKLLFLTPEKTVRRKLREALLAFEIERQYAKGEILAFYLNQIYLGNGAYGVAAAAQTYFTKPLADLTLAEGALLAALPKAPTLYDPFRRPDRARARRDLVLRRLEHLGWADADAVAAARAAPLPAAQPDHGRTAAPYFVEAVRRRLLERLETDLVYQGGLRVYTTLDPGLQRAAEAALAQNLADLDARHPKAEPAQGAILALEVSTGAIRALVGGRAWSESSFDRALQARRQPGSAFKPFTFLAALEAGQTQGTVILDSPASYPGARVGEPWQPKNYDREYLGSMTLRKALALSRNVPTIRTMDRVGRTKVEAVARRLGLAGPFGQGLASALGVGGVTLLELTRAYAALPGGGNLPEPHAVKAVYGLDGRNLWPRPAAPQRVLDPELAYVGVDMLRAVVDSGTGQRARALPFAVGGKTGTTDDQRDAWFVGFSSRLALGVWVGRDDNTPLGAGETGARAALPPWIDTMLATATQGPPPPWAVPPGIEFTEIDLVSGLQAGPRCAQTVYAAFARNTAPARRCDREGFQWDHVAGQLRVGDATP